MSLSALNTRYARGNRREKKSSMDEREREICQYVRIRPRLTHTYTLLRLFKETRRQRGRERIAQRVEMAAYLCA